MVWFAEDNELENSKDPFETLDPPPPDFSFADSFLDFDSIQHWFDDKSSTDMPPIPDNTTKPIHSDPPIHMITTTALPRSDPNSIVEIPERDQLITLGDTIEEGIGKISLVGGFENSFGIRGNAVHIEALVDEGESSRTASSSSSSSTSSASSCSSDSGSHSDDDNEERKHLDKQGERGTEVVNQELEEGEIRDSDDGRERVAKTAAVDDEDDDEDVEKMVSWNDDDEVDEASGRPIRSKNELEILPRVPQVGVTLEQHHQMLPVGVVTSIMGTKVIVEGLEKHDPLDEGSILWMPESRTPLGFVDEVFGPVRNPYYVVRYNSENEVPAGIYEGVLISFIPEFANLVLNKKDLYKKGYDVSGMNDEEVADESEFSDDEKEAEYRRMQKLTKRGINDQNQNPRNRKNNRKKIPVKAGAMLAIPLHNQGNCPRLPGIGQGHDGANTITPPFPPSSLNTHTGLNGIRTSGLSPPQPQTALLPIGSLANGASCFSQNPQNSNQFPVPEALLRNGFPTNGASWFSQNPQNSNQFPVPEILFQHQFNSTEGSLSTNMFCGVAVQHNVSAQPTYAPGLVGQNQMALGLSSQSHSTWLQPPECSGGRGILFNEMQLERNHNLFPGTISGNIHVPGQFHPGVSASRGRKTCHRGGRSRGWRPMK